ncbi:hypothetical protein VPNG_03009 [Cytospora leucostoma]|uniref:Uncharacterized protein n=1 Tax=Cytospora leucostoma TaxID=1230097 RepID=A0A423XGA2_9PEZI|nr:hypothetical protein VPNG_03009 [Cytospora leucostoma]
MHLFSLPTPLLAITLSAFYGSSVCFPLAEEEGHVGRLHAVRPRETYSVVPIDGGGSSSTQATTTVVETVTASSPTTTLIDITTAISTDDTTTTVTETDVISVEVPTTIISAASITQTQTPSDSSFFCRDVLSLDSQALFHDRVREYEFYHSGVSASIWNIEHPSNAVNLQAYWRGADAHNISHEHGLRLQWLVPEKINIGRRRTVGQQRPDQTADNE